MNAPQNNPEAEISVLGACLQNAGARKTACELVNAADFFDTTRGEAFAIVEDFEARGEPADLVTVYQAAIERKVNDRVTATLLHDLVEAVPTAANVAAHARIVRDLSIRRRTAAELKATHDKVLADGAGLPAVLAEHRQRLDQLAMGTACRDALDVVNLADVMPEAVSWLWPGRIPRGKLSLLIGDPGQGKSYLTMDLAARVTRGTAWPDGGRAPSGAVLLLTAEDGLADTIRPRLDALGADPARIFAVRGRKIPGGEAPAMFDLSRDLADLEDLIAHHHPVLLVVDPVSAYLGGKTDSFKDADVRRVLTPLAAQAERHRLAVVAVMHMTKDAQRKVIYRAQASIAFVGQARAVFAVAEDPEDKTRRLLLPVKMNVGPYPPGLAFRLVGNGGDIARLEWDAAPVVVDAETALGAREAPEARSEQEDAEAFLQDFLAGGPQAADEVVRQARAAGVAERTLKRAKAILGVKSEKSGYGGGWTWRLPAKGAEASEGCQGCQESPIGSLGPLGTLRAAEVGAAPEELVGVDL